MTGPVCRPPGPQPSGGRDLRLSACAGTKEVFGGRNGHEASRPRGGSGHRAAARKSRGARLEDAYAAYAPMVLAYVSRYVGRDEAEDVMQRTFLDAWRHAGRYDPGQRFTGWLFTIAHRRAVDTLRARRHQVVDLECLRELSGEDGREMVSRFADAADVRAAVAQLPDHERVVVEMR